MPEIVTVPGERLQFIKASVVAEALRSNGTLEEVLVRTGQHFDPNMSDVFFSELGLPRPAHSLDIYGSGHGDRTDRMLASVERVLLAERPQAVLVYGDTNSTLAAVKLHIPVAHVEAGLRSFNLAMPEEVNRILTDRISQWLFTPTAAAREHLLREGVAPQQIVEVGDVMFDAALRHGDRAAGGASVRQALGLQAGAYVLVTVHRAENTDVPARMLAIVEAVRAVARELPVVWPVHPRVAATLRAQAPDLAVYPAVHLIEPVGYLDMVQLERDAAVVATDSGGVQKEAFFHRVPCVTLRDETEWVELVDAGWNRLAPPLSGTTVAAAVLAARGQRGADVQPYGTGDAAQKIARRLAHELG